MGRFKHRTEIEIMIQARHRYAGRIQAAVRRLLAIGRLYAHLVARLTWVTLQPNWEPSRTTVHWGQPTSLIRDAVPLSLSNRVTRYDMLQQWFSHNHGLHS